MVTYGSEASIIYKETGNKINVFECWIYHRVPKVNWKDSVSNKEILEKIMNKYTFIQFCKEKSCVLWTYL